MSEIPGLHEGVEAVRVMFQGTEMFLRLFGDMSKWSLEKLAKVVALTYHHMNKKKSEMKEGEVNFHDLITKNKSGVGMMQIENEHLLELVQFAKEMGLSYSIMPDINKKDKYCEIAFPEYQGEAFRYFISQHMDIARSYTYGEYFDNSNPVDMEKEIKGLGREAVEYAKELKDKNINPDIQKEVKHSDGIPNDLNERVMIKIDTSFLNESENKDMILVAVPNTEDEYIRIPKMDLTKKEDAYYIHLRPDAGYTVCTKEEKPVMKDEANMIITGNEYKNAVDNIPRNNEVNKEKKEKAKSSVKLVRKNEEGKLEEKVVKTIKKDKGKIELIPNIDLKR